MEQGLAPQTVGTIIKNVKMISRYVREEGVKVSPFVLTDAFFKPDNVSREEIYFNEAEIQRIYEYDFSDVEHLDNARDLFIIGMNTGLRVSRPYEANQ